MDFERRMLQSNGDQLFYNFDLENQQELCGVHLF